MAIKPCSWCRQDVCMKICTPPSFDDAAMLLARRGATNHEIEHTMELWCAEAVARAQAWAEREDRLIAEEERRAAEDKASDNEYEKVEDR